MGELFLLVRQSINIIIIPLFLLRSIVIYKFYHFQRMIHPNLRILTTYQEVTYHPLKRERV